MTLITMSAKELDRFQIIKKLIDRHLNGPTAARLLGLTTRQIRRLKAKVSRHGAQGLIHGNRGKASHNQINEQEKSKIIKLLREHYFDFKPTFASEKLKENHHLAHDPKTIRQIMINEGLWRPRAKEKVSVHRAWRERRSHYGEMIQFDGSYEHWLENRGGTGESCLLAAIDDATGKIVAARFAEHEGVFPVFGFWRDYLVKYGRPRSIYLDKFSTYNVNHELAKENSDTLTQFERAAQEFHIELIKANSPQAKGRVERLFATLQDRLIKELRLAGVSTINEANIFLEKIFIPEFNAKFSVEPRNKTNLHQRLTAKELNGLPGILSRQARRTILNDFTFSFKNQWHQLVKEQPATVCKNDVVIIEERLDRTIHVRLRGKYLNYELLPKRPARQINKQIWVLPAIHVPAADHPWRLADRAKILAKLNQPSRTFLFPAK
ncbi:hypothetical protein COT97_05780 [Candidatus Falkowbacteria bacterium CG10_big_fil_rev_8_21_14_0_10_39_11]|uniref:Integrase catalytic domain-containing protein n=1 Tax=Candidatus Falkowbacteria bacterium CG10_big_fil_rev_8_21_14_0_10_39_11 TaxID=1974565 RepID=A0A2H0V3B9_9BACT|nr:MAG: hypothetical protein COT97_05780 [Candidatus Falkowbacteria bacterium CG10_big_fil_rev_8_21_14_0_10_39_11]